MPFRGDKYVTPLYDAGGPGRPIQGGTGVWLSVGYRRFLVTAAHVVDERFLWFPMERGYKRLESPGVITNVPDGGRKTDRTDLAIFHLNEADIGAMNPFFQFVSEDMLEVELQLGAGERYEVCGYP